MKLNYNQFKLLNQTFIILMHSAERVFTILESYYQDEYRLSEDYKQLVKKYGRIQAEQILQRTSHEILQRDDKMRVGDLFRQGKRMHELFERVTLHGLDSAHENDIHAFDALMNDSQAVVRLYLRLFNMGNDGIYKAEQYMQKHTREDGNAVDRELIELFNPKID